MSNKRTQVDLQQMIGTEWKSVNNPKLSVVHLRDVGLEYVMYSYPRGRGDIAHDICRLSVWNEYFTPIEEGAELTEKTEFIVGMNWAIKEPSEDKHYERAFNAIVKLIDDKIEESKG